MRDGAPVAIAISQESGRRVELHDDRVKRAFREFDDFRVQEIVSDGGTDGIGSGPDWCECGHIWHNHFDGCRLCGCAEFVDEDSEEATKIVTDGGQNTYLDDNQEWFIIGLVENALSRREQGQWEACRRLTQQAIVKLDRGTRAHRLIRDGCCSESHPRERQWRDSLERAKTALEVRDR